MGEFYLLTWEMYLIIFLYKSFVPLLREISQLQQKDLFPASLKFKQDFPCMCFLSSGEIVFSRSGTCKPA